MTVPDPATFPRSASIPYFVVFTTTPRSSSLAREIATDATIVVSLLRRVNSSPTVVRPAPSPSSTSSSFSDEAESPSTSSWLRKRVPRSASAFSIRSSFFEDSDHPKRSFSFKKADVPSRDKPLPPTPPDSLAEVQGKSETRTLHTDVSIGFPKRPRHRCEPHQRHPSLDTHASLPDGLYKGKLQLDKNMLPAIDWAGMGVQVCTLPCYLHAGIDPKSFCFSIIWRFPSSLARTNAGHGCQYEYSETFYSSLVGCCSSRSFSS